MTENQKTLAFVLAAAVALGAAWMGKPRAIGIDPSEQVGEVLFPALDDPLKAQQMEIVEVTPDGDLKEFEVRQKEGLWVLPSHQDYPADAEDNLKEAATALVDLRVVNVASEKKSDHKTYGVIRPNPDEPEANTEGVGKLVTIRDDANKVLAEVIIGQAVQNQESQRYVRAGNLDQVFVVELDPSRMSTNFEDWVERDVLDLNSFDIKDMVVRDYSVTRSLNPQTMRLSVSEEPRFNLEVRDEDAQWQLVSLEEYGVDGMQATQLLPGEELDQEALNTMKATLDELKIVDVEAKPPGLVAGSRPDGDEWRNPDGIQRLVQNGFYPTEAEDGTIRIRSSDGEIQVKNQDGVVYTLWFGEIAGIESAGNDSLNRYVMIQASVDDSMFEKPVLNLTEEELASVSQAANAVELDEDDSPGGGESGADEATASNDAAPVADGEAGESDDTESTGEGDAEAAAETETAAAEPETETEGDDEEATAATAEPETDPAADEQMAAERDLKLKEYERALDEYNDKIKLADEKAQTLNYRFADWYYVVSEDEYRKIHLSRSDVITESAEAAAEGSDIDAFRMLEEGGLARPPAP
ncbi:MAG: DUF4340 domain-containing protein [Planctomycetota bacterium]